MGGELADAADTAFSLLMYADENCGNPIDFVGLDVLPRVVLFVVLLDVEVWGTMYCDEPAGGGEAVSYIDSGSDMCCECCRGALEARYAPATFPDNGCEYCRCKGANGLVSVPLDVEPLLLKRFAEC